MATATLPVVGEFGTYSIGSDRYVVEVLSVTPSGKTVVTRDAKVLPANGPLPGDHELLGVQVGTFVVLPHETGRVRKFTLRDTGYYCAVGTTYSFFYPGRVDPYRDPSF